ncbi:hypothetical protein SUGI_0035680 [Cryptomeria japonica]|uniref:shugoshin-1 n=1 Tax=Cryptomeria japonica TaxID=3369 RepID=UPI002408B80D|nr:shugoshin-1 [Cryptomeria japonica]GLJ06299.1 hypothetical protein SUGI_0035680 [Cryptomeria japonica]
MSPWVFERLDSLNAGEPTAGEQFEPFSTLQSTVNADGRRFSDVTNTHSFSRRRKNPESLCSTRICNKENSENQEIAYLKNLVIQKETILESTRQELQKALSYSYKTSQQNKQLTQTNGQIFAELCDLREKCKVLEHKYNQMTAVFRLKRTELEGKVRDLSQKLENKHPSLTKDCGQSDNQFHSEPGHLSSRQNQNCSCENLDQDSNHGENSPRTNLPKKEGKRDGKREADSFSRANMSVNEDAPNEKRIFLRRHSTHVSYKEPNLNTKLRRSDPTVSTQKLLQSNNHTTSNVLENLDKASKGDITNEVESSSRINLLANEENKNNKRVGSKQCPSSSINGDLNLIANTKHQSRVHQHHLQENAACNDSIFNTTLDAAELRRSSTGRPIRKAVETVSSYKEIPRNVKLRRSQ